METVAKSKEQKNHQNSKSTDDGIKQSQLMELFVDELKDIYWAEKALLKAIPKMISHASCSKLTDALEGHLTQTEQHVTRLEKVFEIIGTKAEAVKCEAMSGLIEEAGEIMDECEEGAMRDAGIISAGQKVEHYEIATYGTLSHFADLLGFKNAVQLLTETLVEEKAADEKLSEIALETVNIHAAEENM